jgi:hypothetical protein
LPYTRNRSRNFKVGGGVIHALPGLATGGTIRRAGAALVGEAGPELVTLPRGANVMPIPAVAGLGGALPLDPGVERPIQVQLVVDGRVLAETVARHVANKRARR